MFLIIIANQNIFKVTNYVTFINYTFFFIKNFTTGFALHIQLFCIVTLTVNCPMKLIIQCKII